MSIRPALLHHGFEGALDRGGIGHIAFDKGSVPSPAPDFLCGSGAAFLVDIDQKHLCARFSETLGRALSDPEGSARDDGNLIGEIENSLTHVKHLLLELPLWQRLMARVLSVDSIPFFSPPGGK